MRSFGIRLLEDEKEKLRKKAELSIGKMCQVRLFGNHNLNMLAVQKHSGTHRRGPVVQLV